MFDSNRLYPCQGKIDSELPGKFSGSRDVRRTCGERFSRVRLEMTDSGHGFFERNERRKARSIIESSLVRSRREK